MQCIQFLRLHLLLRTSNHSYNTVMSIHKRIKSDTITNYKEPATRAFLYPCIIEVGSIRGFSKVMTNEERTPALGCYMWGASITITSISVVSTVRLSKYDYIIFKVVS
jgi:hypothetical protein